MLGEMVFFPSAGEAKEEESPESCRRILSLHIYYFGDNEGLNALLDHVGEQNPFTKRIIEAAIPFMAPNTRKPFKERQAVDVKFRDLISRMTNLDPDARITAREALEHEWFRSERGVIAPEEEFEAARAAYERERHS